MDTGKFFFFTLFTWLFSYVVDHFCGIHFIVWKSLMAEWLEQASQ